MLYSAHLLIILKLALLLAEAREQIHQPHLKHKCPVWEYVLFTYMTIARHWQHISNTLATH